MSPKPKTLYRPARFCSFNWTSRTRMRVLWSQNKMKKNNSRILSLSRALNLLPPLVSRTTDSMKQTSEKMMLMKFQIWCNVALIGSMRVWRTSSKAFRCITRHLRDPTMRQLRRTPTIKLNSMSNLLWWGIEGPASTSTWHQTSRGATCCQPQTIPREEIEFINRHLTPNQGVREWQPFRQVLMEMSISSTLSITPGSGLACVTPRIPSNQATIQYMNERIRSQTWPLTSIEAIWRPPDLTVWMKISWWQLISNRWCTRASETSKR